MGPSFYPYRDVRRALEFFTLPVGPLQCNCYVLWEDPTQALVIDPGDEGNRIADELEHRGLKPKLIVSTHGHFDHVGGVDALRKRFPVPYLIHREDEPILKMLPSGTRMWGITIPPIPTPTGFLSTGKVTLGALEVIAIHTPGHTPGSTCFHAAAPKLVFTGDTLFAQSIGRTDFPGGNMQQELDSIHDELLTLPPETKVLPGHGPATTIGDEAENNPFLA